MENRAGASGIIGVDAVAKSAPDGYTLILTQTSLAINPGMFPKMPYDALRDLAPITEMVTTGSLLVVRGTTPEEFSGRISSETQKWAKVVKTAGIKPE
ncbi:MAG: LacI family transcriptional regulator [Betaproteobacteria bacterium]|nr:LacI family transcriptional regulator [Betaproteobacteria bacterium]